MTAPKLSTTLAAAALCVAVLGSTPIGHAAAQLVVPKNSVGTVQIKKQAVTGAKVKDGTLTAADFKPGQLPAGPVGSTGPAGPAGEKGATGPSGLSALERKFGQATILQSGGSAQITATCPAGKTAVAGGYSGSNNLAATSSYALNATTWAVRMLNVGNSQGGFSTYVMCAVVAS